MDLLTAYQMFGDIWKFYKRFQEVENNDTYWERTISEAHEILEKYQTELYMWELGKSSSKKKVF